MERILPDEDISTERRGWVTVRHRRDMPLDEVMEALRTPGVMLKSSPKYETRRVGRWVVKSSRIQCGIGFLKHTLNRKRYRRAWIAALHLCRRGVGVPTPHAFVEKGGFGIVLGNAMISEYLEGGRTVEQHADLIVQRGAAPEEIQEFLASLADAVNALEVAGAYHTDLSGKNILTRDGRSFFFIDLDGVVLDRPYTNEWRLKNHVQLYDSFSDRWDPQHLCPFIARMLPVGHDVDAWIGLVQDGQARRRARHVGVSNAREP